MRDQPTEGIQQSINVGIEETIGIRADPEVGVLLVERYLDFAQRLADYYVVMAKGAVEACGDTRAPRPPSSHPSERATGVRTDSLLGLLQLADGLCPVGGFALVWARDLRSGRHALGPS